MPAAEIPPGTLVNADSLSSAGAVIRDSFNFTTGAMRFKSSNSVIANSSVHSEGCRVQSGTTKCKTASLEISYLQSWFEGPAFIENVTIKENFWFYWVIILRCDFLMGASGRVEAPSHEFLWSAKSVVSATKL